MHFIHVGCWNKGPCEINNGTNAVSRVMTSIKNYVDDANKTENKVDFLVLAGDNYYPEKSKQKKLKQENDPININKKKPITLKSYLNLKKYLILTSLIQDLTVLHQFRHINIFYLVIMNIMINL